MDAPSKLGISLGCSQFTNGMIFYNPKMDNFCVSADYLLDSEQKIGNVFPSMQYNEEFFAKFVSQEDDNSPPTYEIGDSVYVQCQNLYDIYEEKVLMPPTNLTKMYMIQLEDSDKPIDVDPKHMFNNQNVPASGKLSNTLHFFQPEWLKRYQKVTIMDKGSYLHGYLDLSKDNMWIVVGRDPDGRVTETIPVHNSQYSWKMRMQENTFDIGDLTLQGKCLII